MLIASVAISPTDAFSHALMAARPRAFMRAFSLEGGRSSREERSTQSDEPDQTFAESSSEASSLALVTSCTDASSHALWAVGLEALARALWLGGGRSSREERPTRSDKPDQSYAVSLTYVSSHALMAAWPVFAALA